MPVVNLTTAARVFIEAIQTRRPDSVKFDVFLLVMDATSYMKSNRASSELSQAGTYYVYSRVCETARGLYRNVGKLVTNRKKIFVKSLRRLDLL
jgi:hypothetical protein